MFNLEKITYLKRDDETTFEKFKKGEFSGYSVSQSTTVDEVLKYGLNKKIIPNIAETFPDPRKRFEVPMDVVLLTQMAQKLHNREGMPDSPQLINDVEIFSMLGHAPIQLKEGFNNRNKKEREAPFHGEVLKHILNGVKENQLLDWYNKDVVNTFISAADKRNHQLKICDGMEINIDKKYLSKFPNAGVKTDKDGKNKYGYKVVWLMDLLGNKGIITHLKFAPINKHDTPLAKELFREVKLEKNTKIIFDRGFLDFELINYLKTTLKIDVFIPLKQNLRLTKKIIVNKIDDPNFKQNPVYKEQTFWELNAKDLNPLGLNDEYSGLFKKGALVRVTKSNGEIIHIPFVTTDGRQTGNSIIKTYALRVEIEEAHRQLKCNLNLEKHPSRKMTHIIFRMISLIMAFNTYSLFMNDSVNGDKSASIKSARQKRKLEMNPTIVIFCENTFGLTKLSKLMIMSLGLEENLRIGIINRFSSIDEVSFVT